MVLRLVQLPQGALLSHLSFKRLHYSEKLCLIVNKQEMNTLTSAHTTVILERICLEHSWKEWNNKIHEDSRARWGRLSRRGGLLGLRGRRSSIHNDWPRCRPRWIERNGKDSLCQWWGVKLLFCDWPWLLFLPNCRSFTHKCPVQPWIYIYIW